jgi:hypothetical protein
MTTSVFALPVSIEQIAATIRQMNRQEQQRLLDLAPELRALASRPTARTKQQIQESVRRLQTEVLVFVNQRPLTPDLPFLGNLTLAQYHALSDAEKTRLWDEWAVSDLLTLNEQEVAPDALPVG